MDDRKQKMMLSLALLLLLVSVGYRVMHPYVQPRVDRLTHTGSRPIAGDVVSPFEKKSAGMAEPPAYSNMIFDQFFNQPVCSGELVNDVFALHPGEPQTISSDKTAHGSSGETGKIHSVNPAPPPPDLLKKTVDYLLSFTFMGGFQRGNEKAVFLSRGNQVLVARIGDRINGKYLIKAIEENAITIKALDINETIHLDMREFNDKQE